MQDEPFHVPQTQRYCSGLFHRWDPKITTFPGLYIIGTAHARTLQLLGSVCLPDQYLPLVRFIAAVRTAQCNIVLTLHWYCRSCMFANNALSTAQSKISYIICHMQLLVCGKICNQSALLLESQHVSACLRTGSGLQHNTAEKLQFGAWSDLLCSLAQCIQATSSTGHLCCLHRNGKQAQAFFQSMVALDILLGMTHRLHRPVVSHWPMHQQ